MTPPISRGFLFYTKFNVENKVHYLVFRVQTVPRKIFRNRRMTVLQIYASTGLAVSAKKRTNFFFLKSQFYRYTDFHATYKLAPGGNSSLRSESPSEAPNKFHWSCLLLETKKLPSFLPRGKMKKIDF